MDALRGYFHPSRWVKRSPLHSTKKIQKLVRTRPILEFELTVGSLLQKHRALNCELPFFSTASKLCTRMEFSWKNYSFFDLFYLGRKIGKMVTDWIWPFPSKNLSVWISEITCLWLLGRRKNISCSLVSVISRRPDQARGLLLRIATCIDARSLHVKGLQVITWWTRYHNRVSYMVAFTGWTESRFFTHSYT